jgi:hypothetical protein
VFGTAVVMAVFSANAATCWLQKEHRLKRMTRLNIQKMYVYNVFFEILVWTAV